MLQPTDIVTFMVRLRRELAEHCRPDGQINHITALNATIGENADTSMIRQAVLDLKQQGIYLRKDFTVVAASSHKGNQEDFLNGEGPETDLIIVCDQYSPSPFDYWRYDALLNQEHLKSGAWETAVQRLEAKFVSVQGNKTIATLFEQKGTLVPFEHKKTSEGISYIAKSSLNQFPHLRLVEGSYGRKLIEVIPQFC